MKLFLLLSGMALATAEVLNLNKQCWYPSAQKCGKSGPCAWCGDGACCRRGRKEDGCWDGVNYSGQSNKEHRCAPIMNLPEPTAPPTDPPTASPTNPTASPTDPPTPLPALKNIGVRCKDDCTGSELGGACPAFCGSEGGCCKKGTGECGPEDGGCDGYRCCAALSTAPPTEPPTEPPTPKPTMPPTFRTECASITPKMEKNRKVWVHRCLLPTDPDDNSENFKKCYAYSRVAGTHTWGRPKELGRKFHWACHDVLSDEKALERGYGVVRTQAGDKVKYKFPFGKVKEGAKHVDDVEMYLRSAGNDKEHGRRYDTIKQDGKCKGLFQCTSGQSVVKSMDNYCPDRAGLRKKLAHKPTIEQCMTYCDENPACYGFNFNVEYGCYFVGIPYTGQGDGRGDADTLGCLSANPNPRVWTYYKCGQLDAYGKCISAV